MARLRFSPNMSILALDTSLDACSAALLAVGGDVRARATRDIGRGHAEVLMAVIGDVFAAAGTTPRDLSRVVVTIGPGSFTGIRVGLAAARGIGVAAGIPVIGVTTLEAIADEALAQAPGPVLVAIDARRGEVYAGLYDAASAGSTALAERTPPAAMGHAAAAALAIEAGARVVGSGAALVAAASVGRLDAGPATRFPDIVRVGLIGASREPPTRAPAPLYLRAADAKPQDGFRIARAVATAGDPLPSSPSSPPSSPPSPPSPEVRP